MNFQDEVLDYGIETSSSSSAQQHLPIHPSQLTQLHQITNQNQQSNTQPTGIIIQELTWYTTDQEIELILINSGISDDFTEIRFHENKISGKSLGKVYIHFNKYESVIKAKDALEETVLHGCKLKISMVDETQRLDPFAEAPAPSISNQRTRRNFSNTPYDRRNPYSNPYDYYRQGYGPGHESSYGYPSRNSGRYR